MKTAIAAGCCPVGVTWGYRSETELRNSGARYLVYQPLELIQLFI
jgi:phosphoglycolate phosphatase